jgi:hypothetical protein
MNNNKSLSLNELLVLRNKYAEKVVKKFRNSIKLLNEYDNYINNNKYMMKGGTIDDDFNNLPKITSSFTVDQLNTLQIGYEKIARDSEKLVKNTLIALDDFISNESLDKQKRIEELQKEIKNNTEKLAEMERAKVGIDQQIEEARNAENVKVVSELNALKTKNDTEIRELQMIIDNNKESHEALVKANMACHTSYQAVVKSLSTAASTILNKIDKTPTS